MKPFRFLLLMVTCLSALHVQGQFKGYTWKTLTTTGDLIPREEGDFAEVNGKFYLIGGRRIQETSVFDPGTLTWTTAAKPPVELHHFQAIVYKNEIYLLGAMTGGYPHEKPVANIYIYNPASDTWRVGPAIPAGRLRGAGGAVLYKGKFYLVCGIIDGHWTGNVAWLDEYDPQTNQWTKLAGAPVARDHFKAAIVGHKMYCIGGTQSDAMDKKVLDRTVDQVDIYDFKTGKWSTANAKLPTTRAGTATVVIKNNILIIAGESTRQKVAHNEVEAYNVKTDSFITMPPLVTGRHATGAIYYHKKVYTASGVGNSGGAPLLNSIECFGK